MYNKKQVWTNLVFDWDWNQQPAVVEDYQRAPILKWHESQQYLKVHKRFTFLVFHWHSSEASTSVRAIQLFSYNRTGAALCLSRWSYSLFSNLNKNNKKKREFLLSIVWVQMAKVDLPVNQSVAQRNPCKPSQTFPTPSKPNYIS